MKLNHLLAVLFLLILSACNPDVLDDYSLDHFELVDQNGNTVVFPDDLEGSTVIMSFIYTHCPDICSMITANMAKIYQELEQPDDIKFVLVTFDPERDTPDVLKRYAENFELDQSPFLFLSGESEEIDSMMERFSVRSQITFTTETEEGDSLYFLNHSDKMLLINERSQLLMEYGGSMTPINLIIEDLNRL